MRILRYPALNEPEFMGCVSAFSDSLTSALEATKSFLGRLHAQPKGAAFAFEMQLDSHRYGVMLILERWGEFVNQFGPHMAAIKHAEVVKDAALRIQTAENLMVRTNRLIDAAAQYTPELEQAVDQAVITILRTFSQERAAAEEMSALGPMLPDEFREARRVFLADLDQR
ncbi:MAG: hypothetical protein JNN08_22950 [Bryobacterales bacterium]|nr:hypothetical protein [Bryobacterales bacterium]